LPVRLIKLIRDYGALITVIALVLAFIPQWTVWLMVVLTAVNGLFLLASIAAAARASLRPVADQTGTGVEPDAAEAGPRRRAGAGSKTDGVPDPIDVPSSLRPRPVDPLANRD
jgi:short subunit dehydrogenase-like uncharacterized protein